MSLSERFKRLPEEQILRNEESAKQAREASELLTRLRSTRQEAERLAKEEIERTRKIQREEVEMHPEIVELRRRLRNSEREKETWERKQKDLERSYQNELEKLKRDEANLLEKLQSTQQEELRIQKERENFNFEHEGKEIQFKALDYDLQNLKREEELNYLNDMNVIKGQVNDFEKKMAGIDNNSLKNQLNQVGNDIKSLQDTIEVIMSERSKLVEQNKQVEDDFYQAQRLLNDAKSLEDDKTSELERLKKSVAIGGSFQKDFLTAENHCNELEQKRNKIKGETEFFGKSIEDKSLKISRINEEINRLKMEIEEIEKSQQDDYQKLYDSENNLNRIEVEYKDAKDHLNESKRARDIYLEEKMKLSDQINQLERDLVAIRKSRQDAQNEENKASELNTEIEKNCQELDNQIKSKHDRIDFLNQNSLDLNRKLVEFDLNKAGVEEKRRILNEIQSSWMEWKSKRLGPLQQEHDNLRIWLQSHPRIESSAGMPKTETFRKELENVRKRIDEFQYRFPSRNFEDPEALRTEIKEKEVEIRNNLSFHNDYPSSQRYLNQLKREAEALMRAEVAATHEQKQAAIDKEATELSKLRLALNPQVNLDEEAKRRLWRLNEETGEVGVIGDKVLELCQSRNITLKENN